MRHAFRALAILLLGGLFGACSGERETSVRWVGTWAAAPQAVMPGTLETFHDQQVRLVVHTSIDGAGERLLTFAGKPGAVIAPGGTVTSDALGFDVPAFADLAVTLSLPRTAAATTSHFLALQINYVSAPGSARAADFAAAKIIDIWPFLTAIDVVPRGEATAVVVFGDSTVDA